MKISENELDVINDLIKINNDRVAGFEKAGVNLEGGDNVLISVFAKLAGESRDYVTELTGIAEQSGGEPAEGTSTSGDLHRAWIDVKSVFTGHNVIAILNECERGEDEARIAYREALEPGNDLGFELTEVLKQQLQGITEGHNLIISLRDDAEASEAAENEIDDQEDEEDEGKVAEPGFPMASASNDASGQGLTPHPSYEHAVGEYNQTDQMPERSYGSEPERESQDQQIPGTADSKLMEFFVNELQDLLWAETELAEVLPEMAAAATSAELKAAFEMHQAETETHILRLEKAFETLGLAPETRECEAMAGILDEGEEIIDATEEGTAQRDVGLIFAGQKAEHYEIASYGGMIALAKTLGYEEIAELFALTLDEEKTADAKLTKIAEDQANFAASIECVEN